MGGLPSTDEARSIWEGIWEEEAHHSTALEGNTLRPRQVQLLLFENRVMGSKELKEYLEVRGYGDAALWVYSQAVSGPVRVDKEGKRLGPSSLATLTEIRKIHELVVGPVWQSFPPDNLRQGETPGAFRRGEVEALRVGLKPPEADRVHSLLTDWVDRANDEGLGLGPRHPMEELAELHAEFERIHPFPDGNGRVGRLVLNLLLVRWGYPPAVIHKQNRTRYLDSLKRADSADAGPLGELLARSVQHGIDRFLIPGLAGPHRYVPLSALTDTGLSQNALTLAAQRGRLAATQRNGQWYSSRQCVEDYKHTRYKRRSRDAPA